MSEKVLCIDIGGSKILTGILDEKGQVLFSQKRMFSKPDKKQVVDAILEESSAVLKEPSWKEREDEEVIAVGVSIPGLADSEKGLWVYAPFSQIHNFNVRELLEEHFHKPVFLENDGNICAVGEKRFGLAKDTDDFLWITVSNGVGSGFFLNGRLYNGAFKGAGEMGHVKVENDGALCPCGGHGCLEAYASGPGIVRRYRELTGTEEEITALEISNRARENDEAALKVFQDEGMYLGRAIAHAVNLLNLPLVVLGGGIAGAYDLFRVSLEDTLKKQVFGDANRKLRVVTTALGYEASLIGAGALAFDGIEFSSFKRDC